jgi:manganese/iron transport system permease protein/iron/zinc/copper transport system permease protein
VSYFLDPFQYDFFFRALVVSSLIGALAGVTGPFVLVRRMAYIGQGMSQSILGGVAVGVSLGIDLYFGAAVSAAMAAALIYWIRNKGLPVDTAIGIVASVFFAVGVAIVSSSRDRRLNSANLLFGNVLGVQIEDIIVVTVVATVASLFLFANYKSLLAATHNPSVAAAHGIHARFMEIIFNALLATVVVTALQTLGVLLVAATLLIPAATATMTFTSFNKIVFWSAILGFSFAVIGLFISFHRNISSGPAIVLVGSAVFMLNILAGAGTQGVMRRKAMP